jgi:hypothetical protein
MTIDELIEEIAASGVVLILDGRRVRWSGALSKPRREREVAAALGEMPPLAGDDAGFDEDEPA